MRNRRIKKLIKESLAAGENSIQNNEVKADWNELLVSHLANVRQRKINRKKRSKYALLTVSLLVVMFATLLVITSIDEIKAGNFNLIESIKNLGSNTEINQIQEKVGYVPVLEKTFAIYNSYKEMLDKNEIIDYFKSDFVELGFTVDSLHLTIEEKGNTILVYYLREDPIDMYSIQGFFENYNVQQSDAWKFPSSEFYAIIVDNIVVDLHMSSEQNFAHFKKEGVDFIIEYHRLSDDFIENIVRNIKVYGRK